MRKEKVIVSISIGIICIILIAVIFAQFKTVEEADVTGISTAREDELKTMLSTWKAKQEDLQEKLDDTKSRIQEYKDRISSNEASEELLQEELEQTNLLTGQTEVVGEGVIVTIKDNEYIAISSTDLVELVNELRLAGAEAISINDQRIMNMTEIVDVQAILVNQERIVSPYVVKAIGDTKYLVSALSLKNIGFIDKTKNVGKDVELKEDKNIKIPAYSGRREQLKFKYAKEVEE